MGILGELSLGHAGFMCVGAFSGAFFTKLTADLIPNLQVRFVLALIIGAAVAALFGILIGIPVLRLRGDYLAIVTLAFGEIIKNVINALYVGADGNGIHVAMKLSLIHILSLGSLVVAVIFFGWNLLMAKSYGIPQEGLPEYYIVAAAISGLAFWRHRANIVRLANGTENKLWGGKK